jgi:hypothetical protein
MVLKPHKVATPGRSTSQVCHRGLAAPLARELLQESVRWEVGVGDCKKGNALCQNSKEKLPPGGGADPVRWLQTGLVVMMIGLMVSKQVRRLPRQGKHVINI